MGFAGAGGRGKAELDIANSSSLMASIGRRRESLLFWPIAERHVEIARMAERFYVNSALAPGTILLQGPEAHHLATVCRLRRGETICLFNGDGCEYVAEIRGIVRREVELQILSSARPPRELGFRLEIAAPLPKGDRAQFLVEKMTELGVTAFVPLQTARSVVHPRDTKREKLQRYGIEASKQCGRNVLMLIESLTAWPDYVRRDGLPQLRILAHPGAPPASPLGERDVALAVGPEGGFSEEEVELAQRAGWQLVGLGPRTLRVETAALVLATLGSQPALGTGGGPPAPDGK
jgi:16S rRNA (uracil1498-N3)-methyltransferase